MVSNVSAELYLICQVTLDVEIIFVGNFLIFNCWQLISNLKQHLQHILYCKSEHTQRLEAAHGLPLCNPLQLTPMWIPWAKKTSLLHLHWVKAKWLGCAWSTDHKGNRQREAYDKAEGGPWSKVGEVSKSPIWNGTARLGVSKAGSQRFLWPGCLMSEVHLKDQACT